MADADLVIHDAQYTPEEYGSKKTWGHSTYDYVVQIAAAAGVRRLALTHHDPGHDDHFVADIERKARALALQCGTGLDVFCAYEGCELVLEPRSALKPFVTAAPFQASVAQRRFHILVVDDQPDTLTMIVRALEAEQYTVSKATSGPEALRMIDERVPDLVVLDYKMTGMDGLAVMQDAPRQDRDPIPAGADAHRHDRRAQHPRRLRGGGDGLRDQAVFDPAAHRARPRLPRQSSDSV